MTFEEAREIFLNRGYEQVDGGSIYNADKWRDSVIVISDWLQKEPCEDAISRQAVLDKADYTETENGWCGRTVDVKDVESLPPVTPQPKTGYWIKWYEQKENDGCIEHIPHCKCSECGKEYDPHSSQFVKYCNKCGAKMIEPQEEKTESEE